MGTLLCFQVIGKRQRGALGSICFAALISVGQKSSLKAQPEPWCGTAVSQQCHWRGWSSTAGLGHGGREMEGGGGGGRKGKNNTAFPTGLSVIIGQLCLCSRRGVGRDQGHPALPHPSIHPCRGWRSRAGSRRAERSGEGEHQTNTELQGWLQSWPGAGYRHLPAQHKACLSWLLPMQRGEGSELCSQSHPETPRGSWRDPLPTKQPCRGAAATGFAHGVCLLLLICFAEIHIHSPQPAQGKAKPPPDHSASPTQALQARRADPHQNNTTHQQYQPTHAVWQNPAGHPYLPSCPAQLNAMLEPWTQPCSPDSLLCARAQHSPAGTSLPAGLSSFWQGGGKLVGNREPFVADLQP